MVNFSSNTDFIFHSLKCEAPNSVSIKKQKEQMFT